MRKNCEGKFVLCLFVLLSLFTYDAMTINALKYEICLVLRELGRKEREVLQKMAEVTKEGFLLKQQLIEEAKKGQQEKQVRFAGM